jgi:hypothetical protein
MEGSCSTGQSPQWAVVPVEEEEVNVIHVTVFGSEKHFGLVDIGYMELEVDAATGRKEESSSTESLPSMRILFVLSVYVFLSLVK